MMDPREKVDLDAAAGTPDCVDADEVTLTEVCAETNESARTVRFYILQGLLAGSTRTGPLARYPRSNIAKIKRIRRLQDQGFNLQQIREELAKAGEADPMMAQQAMEVPVKPVSSAYEYTKNLLGGLLAGREQSQLPFVPAAMRAPMPMPPPPSPAPMARSSPADPGQTKTGQARSQWERIQLHADLELHVRRPLSPHVNRRLDDLLKVAKQLFTEEK